MLPNIPCLITKDQGNLKTALFIAQYLSDKVGARELLFGSTPKDQFEVNCISSCLKQYANNIF